MKRRKFPIALKVVITVLVILVVGFLTLGFTKKEMEPLLVVSDVNKEDVMKLDFNGANVLVLGYKGDNVKVVPSISVKDSGITPQITKEENLVKLIDFKPIEPKHNFKTKVREWVSLLKSEANLLGYHFTVYVPKDVSVSITADKLRAENCNLIYVEGKEAVLRSCNIEKGFISKALNNKVRDCKINKNSTFEREIEESRDNKYEE